MGKSVREKPRVLYFIIVLCFPIVFFLGAETVLKILRFPVFTATDYGSRISNFQNCRFSPYDLEKTCRLDPVSGNKVKIFAFGESTVEGFPYAKENRFTSVLQRDLDERFPGKFYVANFGKTCRDSFFVRDCIERVADHHPEFIIVYAGHNDYINLFHPDNTARIFRNNRVAGKLLLFLRGNSRLYSLMNRFLFSAEGGETYPFRTEEDFLARHDFLVKQYQENLKAMYETATSIGAKLLVMTPASNLSEFKAGYWHYPDPVYQALQKKSWHFMDQGTLALKNKHWVEADTLFKQAKDTDPVPSRVSEKFNDALRSFARNHRSVFLVDYARFLQEKFGKVGLGCNIFGEGTYCDQFHPNGLGHRLMAEILLPEIILHSGISIAE